MDWKKPETPMVSSDPPPQIFYETTLLPYPAGGLGLYPMVLDPAILTLLIPLALYCWY